MKRAILLILVAVAAWQGFTAHADRDADTLTASTSATRHAARDANRGPYSAATAQAAGTGDRCDGRTHCSQMTSCSEAAWFLRNCPGTQMDGDGDGVPCERQWCR